jgi:hypothetical protein
MLRGGLTCVIRLVSEALWRSQSLGVTRIARCMVANEIAGSRSGLENDRSGATGSISARASVGAKAAVDPYYIVRRAFYRALKKGKSPRSRSPMGRSPGGD